MKWLFWFIVFVVIMTCFKCTWFDVFQLPDIGAVSCGEGFYYEDSMAGPVSTHEDMMAMEKLALKCPPEDWERRIRTDIMENAILIGGEVCVINWELTPEAHERAYLHHCLGIDQL